MESEDYDDINRVKLPEHVDKETQAVNERLIMKYFGNKLNGTRRQKHTSSGDKKTEPFDNSRKWSFVKPAVLACILTGLLYVSKMDSLVNFLSFTNKTFINTLIYYGLFFLIVFIAVLITYSPS